MPEPYLDAAAIRAATFVRHVEIYDTLGSTNDRAAELACDSAIETPALVAARHQTAGRGRGSNTWLSSDGALTFSILLEPAELGIRVTNWPQLSLTAAVAVCDALGIELNPKSEIRNPKSQGLAIKWPNDVLLEGRKVCGILVESPGGKSPAKDRLIVGIGINVNNRLSPEDSNLASGIALCDVTGHPCDIAKLLIQFLKSFEVRTNQLAVNDSLLPAAWQQLSSLKDQRVEIHLGDGRQIRGICAGTDHDGALLVDCDSGRERIYSGSLHSPSR